MIPYIYYIYWCLCDIYDIFAFFRNDFNIEVLKTFVNLHEFSDMLIVQALRYSNVADSW